MERLLRSTPLSDEGIEPGQARHTRTVLAEMPSEETTGLPAHKRKGTDMFSKNLASWDRWARLILGAGILALAFIGPKTGWGWLGLVLIGTAFLGHCPIYVMLGIRTCAPGRRDPKA